MPRKRILRLMTAQERTALERLAGSRSDEVRLVERARIILAVYKFGRLDKAGQEVGCCADTVRKWLTQFDKCSIAGLQDAAKSGRPPTYSEEQKGRLIALARTHPQALHLEFGNWSLDRLTEYANTQLAIPISRAQLARVLEAEGLRWYQEKVYFSERPDPQFAEKRGPSSHSINSPQPTHT